VFWTGALAWWAAGRNKGSVWPDWVELRALGWVVPVGAAFGIFVWTRLRRPGVPARQAERVVRYGTLWMPLYGAAWMFGDGNAQATGSAWLLVGVAGVSLAGMTVLRELYGLAEQPIGYRR
jgi:hypothetical protein